MHKIGILGGGFNPVSKGHIQIAQLVLAKTNLDKVWLMPCYDHRFKNDLVNSIHRLEMCELVCQNFTNIEVSNYEIENKLNGSVYDLINLLSKDYSKDFEFSFIIGSDNVITFDKWKNAKQLKKITKFITVPRQGIKIPQGISWYKKSPHVYLDEKDAIIKVSSTEIRILLSGWRKGTLSEKQLNMLNDKIDDNVLSYIKQNNLYRDKNEPKGRQRRIQGLFRRHDL